MEFLEIIPSYQARFRGEMAFRDPSVPSEFRELISNKKSLPFYLARKGQRLWVAHQLEVKVIDLSRCHRIRLANMTPARGRGFISIMAASKGRKSANSIILDYDLHTQVLFDEATLLAEDIGAFLGYKIEVSYGGADC